MSTACEENQLEVASVLIESGAMVNYQNKVLIISIVFNDLLTLLGFSPQKGWSALQAASQNGHKDVVKLLIQSRALLELRNKVCKDHHCTVVALLLPLTSFVVFFCCFHSLHELLVVNIFVQM